MPLTAPQPIWIDTDIIFNRVAEDVDDGLALMMALQNSSVHIVGISLNEQVDNGYEVTQKLLGYYGRYPIPVYKGESAPFDSPEANGEAVKALAAALLKQPLTIVALGSAPNIASLLTFHPHAAKNIKEVVFCAGRQAGVVFNAKGSDIGLPDANFDNAPAALLKVIESDVPVALVGFEASSSIYLDWDNLMAIKNRGRDGDGWVFWRLLMWFAIWKLRLRVDGFIPFDAATMGHVLFPSSLLYHRQIPVRVNTRENDAKDFKDLETKPYLEVSYDYDTPHRVDFAYAAKPEFKKHLMRNLLGRIL